MEGETRDNPDNNEPPLPPGAEPDPSSAEQPLLVTIEFGELSLTPPGTALWSEMVITRGVAEAEQEERIIDDRTAYYIAKHLSTSSTPALRKLAATGEIEMHGIREEVVALIPGTILQIDTWATALGDYCVTHGTRNAIENWLTTIRDQDRVEAEWLRREQLFVRLDELFQMVPPHQRVPNAGKPGWYGLLRADHPLHGGLILFEGEAGERRVWETDSDEELDQRYAAIVEAQRQWILDTFGRAQVSPAPGLRRSRQTHPTSRHPRRHRSRWTAAHKRSRRTRYGRRTTTKAARGGRRTSLTR